MTWIDTPCGRFHCGVDPRGRPVCGWSDLSPPSDDVDDPPADWRLAERVAAWFEDASARRHERFDDLPLPTGTPFERRCWARLRETATGETVSYGELATEIGVPAAARAVGRAMRRNPAPLLVPCHRVVAAGGGLGGYAGVRDQSGRRRGGDRVGTSSALWIKARLLDLERRATASVPEPAAIFSERLQSGVRSGR